MRTLGPVMADAPKNDPTKDPKFKRVLGNLLKAPPKPHAEMKIHKNNPKKKRQKTKQKESK
jgi:hypothetical protein